MNKTEICLRFNFSNFRGSRKKKKSKVLILGSVILKFDLEIPADRIVGGIDNWILGSSIQWLVNNNESFSVFFIFLN